MNTFDILELMDNLSCARILAGAEFERLCNNKKHIDACIFQSIRDSIEQNMMLLQSYLECTQKESEV